MRRRTAFALVCLAAVGLAVPALGQEAAPSAQNGKLAALLRQAQRFYDQGRYKEARDQLARLYKLVTTYPGAAELSKRVDDALRRDAESPHRAATFGTTAGPGAPGRTAKTSPTPPAAAPPLPKDSRYLYERADELVDQGRFDPARRLLAQIDPDDPLFDRARVLRARIDAWQARSRTRKTAAGQKTRIKEYVQNQLSRDLARARRLYNAGRYRETIELCERMLQLAPEDSRVRTLLQDARIDEIDNKVRSVQLASERRLREVLIETEKVGTPPETLPKLTRPKPPPDVRVPGPDEIELARKLNEKVSIDLIDAPLSYVLDLLARSIGINIIVDPEAVKDKTLTINVQNTTLQEVLDFITRNEGVSFTRGKNTIYVTTPDQPMLEIRTFELRKGLTDVLNDITPQMTQQQQQQGRGGRGTRSGTPAQQTPGAKPSGTSDIERLLTEIESGLIDWPTGSYYYLDRKKNILFVRSTPKVLDQIEKMIQALDKDPIQVLVQTRFIEIDAEHFDDLGVTWNLINDYALQKKGGQNSLVIDAGTGTVFDLRIPTSTSNTVSSSDGLTFGVTGILTALQFQATLKTIVAKYKGRLVNAPSVIAMNNRPARFQETEDLWYVDDYRIDRTDLTGAEGVTTSEPVIVPVFAQGPSIGFGLTVTPSVGRDSKDITLLLEPIFRRKSLDSIVSPVILPGDLGTVDIERPIIVDRRMWTTVTVRDGYHVVLGGMVTSSKKEIVAKVPILGDIPLLGWLFKRRTVRNVRKHLLIFVSARIISPTGQTYKTDEEEKEEARKRAELLRTRTGAAVLPEGIGVKGGGVTETRQALGRTLPPAEDVIDVEVKTR